MIGIVFIKTSKRHWTVTKSLGATMLAIPFERPSHTTIGRGTDLQTTHCCGNINSVELPFYVVVIVLIEVTVDAFLVHHERHTTHLVKKTSELRRRQREYNNERRERERSQSNLAKPGWIDHLLSNAWQSRTAGPRYT